MKVEVDRVVVEATEEADARLLDLGVFGRQLRLGHPREVLEIDTMVEEVGLVAALGLLLLHELAAAVEDEVGLAHEALFEALDEAAVGLAKGRVLVAAVVDERRMPDALRDR